MTLTWLKFLLIVAMGYSDGGGKEGKESSSDSYQSCPSLAISKKRAAVSATGG